MNFVLETRKPLHALLATPSFPATSFTRLYVYGLGQLSIYLPHFYIKSSSSINKRRDDCQEIIELSLPAILLH